MRGSAAFRTGVTPGGVLAPAWVRDALWRNARAVPSLDLRFADNKSLVDATTGQNLVTFTRASSGTYVGSDGVLKTATTNLLLRSEEFNDANWNKVNTTVTANSIAAPNGTVTADTITDSNDGAATAHSATTANQVLTSGLTYTISVYAKAGTQPGIAFIFPSAVFTSSLNARFNISTGTIANLDSGLTGSITAVGDGWYRCSATATATATASSGFQIRTSTASTSFYQGNGTGTIYLWGAQLEQSSTVGEYIPTTSTINSAPRFDHNPTTGESLGLLVEEQRTNSIRNNTMVGAVAGTPGTLPTNWSLLGGTGLTTQVVGSGTENGVTYLDFRFSGTTGNTFTGLQFDGSISGLTTATAYTGSVYLKRTAGSLTNLTQPAIYIRYNLSPSGQTDISATVSSLATPSANLVQSRYSVTGTTAGTLSGIGSVFVLFNHSSGVAIDLTLRIGLPQLEQGAFATSVIPTSGTAATRNADVASITGTNFSSWYNQSTGTFFADATLPYTVPATQFPILASANDGTGNNSITLGYLTSGVVGFEVTSLGVSQASMYPNISTAVISRRIAGAYAPNDFAVSANTTAIVTDASGTIPTTSQLRIGDRAGAAVNYSNGTIRRLTFWPARLANSTLQAITQ